MSLSFFLFSFSLSFFLSFFLLSFDLFVVFRSIDGVVASKHKLFIPANNKNNNNAHSFCCLIYPDFNA